MTSRRQFLKTGLGASLAGLVTGVSSRTAIAQPSSRKLIIVLAYGGWDTMWAFDPKPDHSEVDKIPGKVRNFGDLPIWVHDSRSAVTKFFEQWSSVATVINGIAVESLAHESCIDVMLTGALGQKRPDLAARLAKAHGTHLALPYLSLSPQMENRGFEAHTGMLGDSNQLMSLANPNFNFPEPENITPDTGLGFSVDEEAALREYLTKATSSLQNSVQGQPHKTSQLSDYQVAMRHANQLQDHARNPGFLSDRTLVDERSGGWRHVPAAFKDNLSQTAMIQPDLYWDTHAYNSEQGKAYETFFIGLDYLMSELNKHKILDSTDVLVLSEMGRAPMHNRDGGKDHWPWTSALLLSSQVRGQRVIGQSDQLLRPKPINLQTGALDPEGEIIHAEHLLAAISELHQVPAKTWFEKEALGALFV